ncbi:glutathione S-transferase N-terminal domain-containing protein [Halalkalicoccus jeotgali]|uniref:Glutaredoxin n=1 Tax=Halalkalicoccus jeotgali (strain DSM 18796 / CECT 7217 / JCM 14584 / KCTC 4019 / B3) TaxID=795797 RepID=D8J5A8_HALJB|nr:glutathione S-transferase N-terminal domain-containing protein [Halalkalicoccus jeotgali]ADJ13689.1 glutaredoxin [Halalkalicoccus jeotgali B3]ELY34264.1 glutaredoxin [Halalkalicoccus jeotgali B3]
MAPIEFYALDGCPFCAKVESKLDELGVEYTTHSVPSSHAERTDVEEISGQTEVPMIIDPDHGVEGMHESDDIVEYLEETYGSAA